jgi:hypothetical protein
MTRFLTILPMCVLAVATLTIDAEETTSASPTLDALQGAWWFDCQDPAAELVIDGSDYYGDFRGRFNLELRGDVLVLKDGLPSGHDTEVTHEPLSFRVISVSVQKLLLQPLLESASGDTWKLYSCRRDAA